MGLLEYLENIISNNNRQELKFNFRFIPAGAQIGLLGYSENIISNNNRWFKICDKGDDTPAPSHESKKYATFILQVMS
nr:unnamed protein product [Callosobruchus analis]